MQSFLNLLRDVRDHGTLKGNRTKEAAVSVFGREWRHDMSQIRTVTKTDADGNEYEERQYLNFPLVTTRKMHFKSIAVELLWLIRGDTTLDFLHEHGVTIWDEWADPVTGALGPVYGKQWRAWTDVRGDLDQLAQVIDLIKTKPESRRLLVTAWNPAEVHLMRLPPCHYAFQFNVTGDKLSLLMTMRSTDMFLGLPFNIASYALLLLLVSQVTGYNPGELVIHFGDIHIYENHLDVVGIQLERKPMELPCIVLNPVVKKIDAFQLQDISLQHYVSHAKLKGEVAV